MSCDNVSEKKNYFNEDVNFRNNYKYSHFIAWNTSRNQTP